MKKNINPYWVITGLTICLLSCKKPSPEVSYIKINPFQFSSEFATQGTDNQSLSTAWVYVNDNPVGVFEVPCTVPVMSIGKTKITLLAGIKVNGVSAARATYDVLESYSTTVELIEKETTEINPSSKYYTTTQFPLKESFDDPGLSFNTTGASASDVAISRTLSASEVFEGLGSGRVIMPASKNFFEMSTITSLELPTNGTPVFLEMNVKTNNDMRVGIFAENGTQIQQDEIAGINPGENWRKVYIMLHTALQRYPGSKFKIYIGMLRNENSPETISAYFDNVKVVHP